MEFPITELLDYESSVEWILKHFHSKGLRCPICQTTVEQAREFRRTQTSGLLAHRCHECGTAYNLYTGTVFQGTHWSPEQVVLLMRGICKGETTRELAAELQNSSDPASPSASQRRTGTTEYAAPRSEF